MFWKVVSMGLVQCLRNALVVPTIHLPSQAVTATGARRNERIVIMSCILYKQIL